MSNTGIREETPGDFEEVRQITEDAFDSSAEADLVASLRTQAAPVISLVAEEAESVVGHIMFSPVTCEGLDRLVFGLAPMAVCRARQRSGIGSALVRQGLERCRKLGAVGVVVLGHADYYPRFGFCNASKFDLTTEYDVPDDVFMAMELSAGGFSRAGGRIRYHPAFDTL